MPTLLDQSVLLIPAFNEEEALPALLSDIRNLYPALPVVVINDASTDDTSAVARVHGATVLDLPVNLGVAGAMQAGFRWAIAQGYRYVIRSDSDGQHPPAGIALLAEEMERSGADLVIGSRALSAERYENSFLRGLGIRYLSVFLSIICRHRVTDPTSGFQMYNRLLVYYFSNEYPSDYPEPESLALLRRQGYRFSEVGIAFRKRQGGTSSLQGLGSLYFACKVTFALLIDRARGVDLSYCRTELEKKLR